MRKEEERKKMHRRFPFVYFVIAASLLITAISSLTNAIDGLNPLAGYVTGWYNNSTVTTVNATYNSSEVDYLVTLKENGSRVCTSSNGLCNGSNSSSDNNYTLTCSASGTDSFLFNCTRSGGTNFSFVVDNYVVGIGLNVSGRTVSVANLTACNPVTEYSVWDGSSWTCDNDGGGTDTNNYTTSIAFTGNLLTLGRLGMTDLTALLLNNTILLDFANITNVPGFGYSNLTSVTVNNITDFNVKQNYPSTVQLNTTSTSYTASIGNNSINLDATNITAGQLVDARIASADKWNHAGSSNLTGVTVNNVTGFGLRNTNGNMVILNTTAGNYEAGIGNNSITVACQNITGATSDLCTITPGAGSAQNITFNTTFTQYGFGYFENGTQIGTNTLMKKQNGSTVWINNTLNVTNIYSGDYARPGAFQNQFYSCVEQEFYYAQAVTSFAIPYTSAAVGAGTVATINAASNNHVGVVAVSDSATANAGAYFMLSPTAGVMTPQGADDVRHNWQLRSGKAGVITLRTGYIDTITITPPTDGCYLEVNATVTNIAKFVCAAASVRTANATTYAFTNNTWFASSVVYINTTAANATIWDDSGNVVLSVGLRSGINTAVSSPGAIVTQSTTDAAAQIAYFDYFSHCRQYKPQRGWSAGS